MRPTTPDPDKSVKRFYELDQELPTHYDLIVNTDALRPEQAVGLIVAAAEA